MTASTIPTLRLQALARLVAVPHVTAAELSTALYGDAEVMHRMRASSVIAALISLGFARRKGRGRYACTPKGRTHFDAAMRSALEAP